jgi:hypothetical protein
MPSKRLSGVGSISPKLCVEELDCKFDEFRLTFNIQFTLDGHSVCLHRPNEVVGAYDSYKIKDEIEFSYVILIE